MDIKDGDEDNLKAADNSTVTLHQILSKLAKLNVPHFRRIMTSSTVRRHSGGVRLDIPAEFVQEHGDKFQETVLLKERRYGRVCALKLRIDHSKHRNKYKVVIGCGWSQFAKDNGLEVGDELVFCNVAMSKFVVHIFGQDGNPKNRRLLTPDNSTTMNSSRDEIVPGQSNALNVGAEEDHVEHIIKEFNPDANFSNQIKRIKIPKALVNNDIVYPRMTTEFSLTLRRKIDSLVTGFQCPHFVKRIKNVNIRSEGSVQLNIPTEFTHKYGKYVLGFKNRLQGPDGRVMEVKSVKRGQTTRSPQLCFSTGWRAFLLKYQLSLADVLIFSLTAPAFWIVQFVDRSSLSTLDRKQLQHLAKSYLEE